MASWRYERGNRLLTLNEKSATINELHSNHASFLSSKEILEKSATSHIVDYYIPQEEVRFNFIFIKFFVSRFYFIMLF